MKIDKELINEVLGKYIDIEFDYFESLKELIPYLDRNTAEKLEKMLDQWLYADNYGYKENELGNKIEEWTDKIKKVITNKDLVQKLDDMQFKKFQYWDCYDVLSEESLIET